MFSFRAYYIKKAVLFANPGEIQLRLRGGGEAQAKSQEASFTTSLPPVGWFQQAETQYPLDRHENNAY